ncbi:MAG: hemagglutinin repeat-containing protein [Candidatus Sedimenticola sp. 1PA]
MKIGTKILYSAFFCPRDSHCTGSGDEYVHWSSTRTIAFLLALLLTVNPLFAAAGAVLADGRSQQIQAQNGVPIVNIAAPSSGGVSHNRYKQFNVDEHGLILNNSRDIVGTELGGMIDANPNLNNGKSAGLIINEVVEVSRSLLNGYTEVAGQAADVVVANPYGITCDGCGFINTPRVTLTTGRPVMDGGVLKGLSVNGGDVSIQGQGLNADNISQFDIITNAAKLNAALHAKQLNMILGNNRVGYPDLSIQGVQQGQAAEIALDSSALGGMYADRIRLVGTQAGVGVRILGDVAVNTGGLSLTADGKLTVNNIQSTGDVSLRSVSGEIESNGLVHGDQSIVLQAKGVIDNTGTVAAGGDLELTAGELKQRGNLVSGVELQDGVYIASRPGDLVLDVDGAIQNIGRMVSGGNARVQMEMLINDDSAEISAGKGLSMVGSAIDNRGAVIAADGVLSVDLSGSLDNEGMLQSLETLQINAQALDNRHGTISATGIGSSSIQVQGVLDNTQGIIAANSNNLTLTGTQLINEQGAIRHAGSGSLVIDTTAPGPTAISNRSGEIVSNGDITLNAGIDGARSDLDNTSGTLSATAITLRANNLVNNGGTAEGDSVDIMLDGDLHNGADDQQAVGLISALGSVPDALKLIVSGWLDNGSGILQTNAESATIKAARLSNSGSIVHAGKGTLTLDVNGGELDNSDGTIHSNAHLTANAASLNNSQGVMRSINSNLGLDVAGEVSNTDGTIEAGEALRIDAASLNNQGGTLTSLGTGDVVITTSGEMDNSGGTIQSNSNNLTLTVAQLINDQGKVVHRGGGRLQIDADVIANRGGVIGSLGHLVVQGFDALYNTVLNGQRAEIQAERIEFLDGGLVDNAGGLIYGAGDGGISLLSNSMINREGTIHSEGILDLTVQSLDNELGLVQSQDTLTLNLPNFDFSGGTFNSASELVINTRGDLVNGVGNRLLTNGNLTINTDGSITNRGEISSLQDLILSGSWLHNQGDGVITAGNDLLLDFFGNVTNHGRMSGGRALDIGASDLINHGVIAAGSHLETALTGSLHNFNTLFSGGDATLFAAGSVANYEGANIFSLDNITVAADASLRSNTRILNESATIEAYSGDIRFYTGELVNRKARFEVVADAKVSGAITYICGKCRENIYVDYVVQDVYETRVSIDSSAAQIIAGNDLFMTGDRLSNEHSLIAADRNITLDLSGNLENRSSSAQRVTRERTYQFEGHISIWRNLIDNQINPYNRRNSPYNTATLSGGEWRPYTVVTTTPNPGYDPDNLLPVPSQITGYRLASDIDRKVENIGQASSATIQAGGDARVIVAGSFNNGDVEDHAGLPTHTARGENTSANGLMLDDVDTSRPRPVSGSGSSERIDSPSEPLPQATYNPADHLVLPSEGLFTVNRNPAHPYLVETNPSFTSYTDFISSDYFFQGIGYDPDQIPRRLGDGFYETRLLRSAIFESTGRRYLQGLRSDIDQYRYLMDNAIASYDALELSPGIALNEEQMARLTHDIVWMVEQEIEGQKVLVPVYYAAAGRATDLQADGSLLVAQNLSVSAGEVSNSGTLDAKGNLLVTSAGDLLNRGTLSSGETMAVVAQRNIRNTGGRILSSGDALLVARSGDIEIDRSVEQIEFQRAGHNIATKIGTRSQVKIEGDLAMQAGRDLRVAGSTLEAGGDLSATAGRDLQVETVQDYRHRNLATERSRLTDTKVRNEQSSISAGGDMRLGAVEDIEITASNLGADGDLAIQSGGDTRIDSVEDSRYKYRYFHKKKSFGRSKTSLTERSSVETVGANIQSGNNLSIEAGGDLGVKAGTVVAEHDVDLVAGGDIAITPGENSQGSLDYYAKKGWGISLDGFSVFVGKKSKQDRVAQQQTQQVSSTIGSLQGDVNINAGDDVTVTASDLLTPEGDINISGENVTLDAGYDTFQHQETHIRKRSGLTVGVSGGPVDTTKQVISSLDRAANAKDGRLKALSAWRAGRLAKELPDKVENLEHLGKDFENPTESAKKGDPTSGINVEISLGSSKSESRSTTNSRSALGSSALAGGDVNITARDDKNKADSGDINLQGTFVEAENINLNASDDIQLTSAENSQDSRQSTKSSSSGIGVSIGSGGLQVFVEGSKARGLVNQTSDKYLETQLNADEQANLQSGDDTTLEGAQVNAERIEVDTGGDLSIISQQDKEHYRNRHSSKSGRLSVSPGGSASVSVNASELKADSDYQSVQEQSGLFAGEGGFDVQVAQNTRLEGAAIVSEAPKEKNSLSTDTLEYDSIKNSAQYDVESKSISFSSGSGLKGLGGGAASDSGSAENTTYSALSDAEVEIGSNSDTDLSGLKKSKDEAHQTLERIFGPEKVAEIQEQTELTQVFAEEAYIAIGDYFEDAENAEAWAQDARDKQLPQEEIDRRDALANAEREKLVIDKTTAHALAGGLTAILGGGNFVQGAMAAGLSELAAQTLSEQLPNDPLLKNAVATLIGAAVGGERGALITGTADKFNRQLHPTEIATIKKLADGDKEKENRLFAAGCALVRCSEQYPDDHPDKQYWVNLQQQGQSYVQEQDLLLADQTTYGFFEKESFNYSFVDKTNDFLSRNREPVVRTGGALQMVFGGAEAVVGAALIPTCETVIGCIASGFLMVNGSDNASAGAKTLLSGEQYDTLLNQALQGSGLNPQEAALAELVLSLGGGSVATLTRVTKSYNAVDAGGGAASVPKKGTDTSTTQVGNVDVPDSAATLSTRERVLANIADSRAARDSSNIDIFHAKSVQIESGYNADDWLRGSLKEGEVIYSLSPNRKPEFFTSLETLQAGSFDSSAVSRALQVKEHPIFGYRPDVTGYRVTNDFDLLFGKTRANPQFGPGGGDQYLIKDYEKYLEPITTIDLNR